MQATSISKKKKSVFVTTNLTCIEELRDCLSNEMFPTAEEQAWKVKGVVAHYTIITNVVHDRVFPTFIVMSRRIGSIICDETNTQRNLWQPLHIKDPGFKGLPRYY
ncbi:hypothetical protein MTR_1g026420 [Medicago truncatula]|uniref:Uncharacterized protein n=1 Tax=Medicago truncatula TaxID=3880 RepID=A0A072VE10_MEDTR|nr:hypothetical protein MTR_1g026420 [Medicago truncatula]